MAFSARRHPGDFVGLCGVFLFDGPAGKGALALRGRSGVARLRVAQRRNCCVEGAGGACRHLGYAGECACLGFFLRLFSAVACAYSIGLWLPTAIRALSGISTFVIGLLAAIPYLAAAIAMVIVGAHSDRTGERDWHVALPAFVTCFALAAAALRRPSRPRLPLSRSPWRRSSA